MPYFDIEGPENTGKVVEIALATAKERKISHIVVATTTGATASLFKNRPDVKVVAVTHAFGFKEKGKNPLSSEKRKELTEAGIAVFTGTHTLSGAERGITNKAGGGINPVELIAHVLRFFGAGTKVAVEVATAALDAGLIPAEVPVIALGGTHQGVDTALLLVPANANRILETRIQEILAKPR
jgi:hypothetical protein